MLAVESLSTSGDEERLRWTLASSQGTASVYVESNGGEAKALL